MSLDKFGIKEDELAKILQHRVPRKRKIKVSVTGEFSFGLVSDTHLCSIHEKVGELKAFYNYCESIGIDKILHAGDLISGQGIYKGQENEIHTFGADKQVSYFCETYPVIDKIKTYFITGNHDLVFLNHAGIDVGRQIATHRRDMVYLGQYQGDIEFDGIRIRLLHPDGGGSYALSYKAQKIAEQIPSGKKPHILALGHYHTSHYFFYRNIHIFNSACFEGQSLFLLRKGINPTIGGWVINVKYSHETITSITPTFIPFIEGGTL